MAQITRKPFHQLREGIISLGNENLSLLVEPLPDFRWTIPRIDQCVRQTHHALYCRPHGELGFALGGNAGVRLRAQVDLPSNRMTLLRILRLFHVRRVNFPLPHNLIHLFHTFIDSEKEEIDGYVGVWPRPGCTKWSFAAYKKQTFSSKVCRTARRILLLRHFLGSSVNCTSLIVCK